VSAALTIVAEIVLKSLLSNTQHGRYSSLAYAARQSRSAFRIRARSRPACRTSARRATNPTRPRALYLYRGGRDLLYLIHDTLEPWTIGSDVPSGCIRLLPEDLIDLDDRVPTGTRVLVMKHLT
jgi:lipoprotein-anchoring transpeptidase ErfK/SrfK